MHNELIKKILKSSKIKSVQDIDNTLKIEFETGTIHIPATVENCFILKNFFNNNSLRCKESYSIYNPCKEERTKKFELLKREYTKTGEFSFLSSTQKRVKISAYIINNENQKSFIDIILSIEYDDCEPVFIQPFSDKNSLTCLEF